MHGSRELLPRNKRIILPTGIPHEMAGWCATQDGKALLELAFHIIGPFLHSGVWYVFLHEITLITSINVCMLRLQATHFYAKKS